MSEKKITIRIDLAKYKHVDLEVDEALKLLDALRRHFPNAGDIGEVIRYLKNFDEFLDYMRRKFKDYLPVPHKPDDYIRGTVTVDKVRLYKDGDVKRVVLIFDRRIDVNLLKKLLNEIGYSENLIQVEKM